MNEYVTEYVVVYIKKKTIYIYLEHPGGIPIRSPATCSQLEDATSTAHPQDPEPESPGSWRVDVKAGEGETNGHQVQSFRQLR